MSHRPAPVFDAVRKCFGATVAIDDLTLSVQQGEVLGLLGPNGAGKSTSMSLAVGLLQPDAGRVELFGGDPVRPDVRRQLGLAPQALALYDELTGDENLRFFARLQGLSRRACAERAAALLERVGLADRARDRVAAYSGGMKRRLNFAAALLHDPALVLLDEPTAGVDPQSRHAILELVRATKAEGRTVVYTTHYMEEAQRVCDRVAILDHGRVLALGTADELVRAHGGDAIVAVERNGAEERVRTADPVAELSARLAEPGVTGVRVERPNLEVVFLELTGRSLRD